MLRAPFLTLCLLFVPSFAPCQNKEPETRTMEAVLSEIRQLRQDLRAAAVATRRAQIVVYRLHVQERLVERASQDLQNVKAELAQLELQKKYQIEQIKRSEARKDHVENEQQRKEAEEYISQLKSNLEEWSSREPELHANRIEMETQLRIEQGKMDRLQDELDRLENSLEITAFQASNQR